MKIHPKSIVGEWKNPSQAHSKQVDMTHACKALQPGEGVKSRQCTPRCQGKETQRLRGGGPGRHRSEDSGNFAMCHSIF